MDALTPDQRAFAEAHHGLLLDFMAKHELDSDYYGDLAQRYLQTVVRYLSEEALQKYRFSTVVWYHLRSELTNIVRRLERQAVEIPVDNCTAASMPQEAPVDSTLWSQIEEILTYKQCEVIFLRNQGYSNREIADLCGITRKAVEKRFSRIRKILLRLWKEDEKAP